MAPPSQPPHPTLTPQLCLAPNSLRAFLRLSRAAIDDPISQHLNSLSHPSATPFDASSISAARPTSPSRRGLPATTCAGFVSQTLFPAWAARARVLEYCAAVAERETQSLQTGPTDEDDVRRDPGTARGQWGGTTAAVATRGGSLAIGAGVVGPEAGDEPSQRPSLGPDGQAWSSPRRPRVVDERLDPYSARDYSDETPGERLARSIREERSVESIIRARSWGVVKDRCGPAIDRWEEGMKRWENEMDKIQSKLADSSGLDKRPGWGGLWS